MWRRTSIHNALGHLDAYCDRDLYDRTRADTLTATGDPALAGAHAWAAVIVDALRHEAGAGEAPPPAAGTGRPLAPSPDPAALARISDVLAGAVRVPAASPRRAAGRRRAPRDGRRRHRGWRGGCAGTRHGRPAQVPHVRSGRT